MTYFSWPEKLSQQQIEGTQMKTCPLIWLLILTVTPLLQAATTTDTLYSYHDLQTYLGTADTVYLSHERYYGHFVPDTCTTSNHGTTISTFSGCWRRVHRNFSPRFWALGGPAIDNLIGNIVVQEVDAINCAAIAAFQAGGDTVEIEQMYVIDRSVYLLSGNTYLGIGDSSGFVRSNPPVTILTDTARVGDNLLKVEDNRAFRSRQKINIVNGLGFNSLAGHISYTVSINQSLGGDTIMWLSGRKVQRPMLPGDSLSLFFPMMTLRYLDLEKVHLKNLVFDGNHDHYRLNYDWRVNGAIRFNNDVDNLVESCRFYRMPNENMIFCGARVIDCSGQNLNGSAFHLSCGDTYREIELLYNEFSNTNRIDNELMQHSEAAITFSSKVKGLHLAYNRFENLNSWGIGWIKNDDLYNTITDNLIAAPEATAMFIDNYEYRDSNIIYNNKNPYLANKDSIDCWQRQPTFLQELPCRGASDAQHPLQIGDTIRLVLDSLEWLRSNENFVKALRAYYDDAHFRLVQISITHQALASAHQWHSFTDIPQEGQLVFDNGHRDGLLARGNWGYAACSEPGNCRNLEMVFVVEQLPWTTGEVDCPLKALQVIYDGEIGTWENLPTCTNRIHDFDPNLLGQPILSGGLSTATPSPTASSWQVFPNPTREKIYLTAHRGWSGQYQIYSLMGEVLLQGPLSPRAEVSVAALTPGTYWLQVIEKGQSHWRRFTKI